MSYEIRIKRSEYPAATWMLHSAHETPQLAADVAVNLPADMTWIILHEAASDADGMHPLPEDRHVPGSVDATGIPEQGHVLPRVRPGSKAARAAAVA